MARKRLNTPKQYTETEFALKRAEAKAHFLAGKNPDAIDKLLDLVSGRSRQWALKYGWMGERDVVLEKTTQTRLQELLKEHEEIIGELNTIKEKAYDPIYNDEVIPKKFSEASSAYLNTVEVIRKIRTDSIHESFMNDLIEACRELITDNDLLFRVGERFREIYNGHQARTLTSADKLVDIDDK